MTIPTGMGLRLGPESADEPGTGIGNHVRFAAANDAKAVHGETTEDYYQGETVCKDPIWT